MPCRDAFGTLAGVTLHIRQYASFSVFSSVMPASEMAAAIGLLADKVTVRGSRRRGDDERPPVPIHHSWEVRCDDRGLRVDDQLDLLIDRLVPFKGAIRALLDDLHRAEGPEAGAALMIYRHLDDPDGEGDDYQHKLLGWGLSREVLQFALDMDTEIGVDEYGQNYPWYRYFPGQQIDSLRWRLQRQVRRWAPGRLR